MAENGQTIKYIFFSFDYDQENAEENGNTSSIDFVVKYQPNGEGGTRSLPAPPAKSKMADRVWKGVYP